jgi:ATP-dependent RNA helicase UAP56/SUB2
MMFTATLSGDIKLTCRKFMRNATEVLIENESKLTLHGLKQYYVQL